MEDKCTLATTFHQFFEFIPANTKELQAHAFRIRYEVYCEELGYENPEEFSDDLERDDFDDNSLHYLLRHKQSQEFAACVRLAMVDGNHTLPFESICGDSFYIGASSPDTFPADSCVEISRLAVRARYRKGCADQTQSCLVHSPGKKKQVSQYPLITYGLIMACFAGSLHHHFDNVFVMMETRLARRLRMMGVAFEQIGLPVEHRGQRAPYRISPRSAQFQLTTDLQHIIHDMRLVLTDIEPSMKQHPFLVNG